MYPSKYPEIWPREIWVESVIPIKEDIGIRSIPNDPMMRYHMYRVWPPHISYSTRSSVQWDFFRYDENIKEFVECGFINEIIKIF
jgi:hypothetical protein